MSKNMSKNNNTLIFKIIDKIRMTELPPDVCFGLLIINKVKLMGIKLNLINLMKIYNPSDKNLIQKELL